MKLSTFFRFWVLAVFISGMGIGPKDSSAALATRTQMPEFLGKRIWLNTSPLTLKDLQGKVVLVAFWDYAHLASLRNVPYLKQWYEKYRDVGLVVIGVHTPQFGFEENPDFVIQEVKKLAINYPVALDNDSQIWKAYNVLQKPVHYFVDAKGRIRDVHEGEGDYDKQERVLQDLIEEKEGWLDRDVENPKPEVEWDKVKTPALTLGFKRVSYFGGEEYFTADKNQNFKRPAALAPHRFALVGSWTPGEEAVRLVTAPGSLLLRYHASRVYLVMGTQNSTALPAEVLWDGRPVVKEMWGKDVVAHGEKSYLFVKDYKMYQAVDSRGTYGEHVFEIIFEEPNAEVYAVEFG